MTEIDGEIIRQIGDRFKKITRPVGAKRRQRKRHENEAGLGSVNECQESSKADSEGQGGKSVESFDANETKLEPVLCLQSDGEKAQLQGAEESVDKEVLVCTKETTEKESAILNGIAQKVGMFPEGVRLADEQTNHDDTTAADDGEEEEGHDEVDIGGRRFQLDISSSLIKEARSSDQDQCNKLAGTIAAQALRNNSELTKVAASADPVPIWNEIKKFVLCKISR